MPHIVLKHSEKLLSDAKASTLLNLLTKQLAEIETFNIAAIKSRAQSFGLFQVAEGGPETKQAFAHIEVALLEGRPKNVLEEVSNQLFSSLEKELATEKASLSLEVREMQAAYYKKN